MKIEVTGFLENDRNQIANLVEYCANTLIPEIADGLVISVRATRNDDYEAVVEVDELDQGLKDPRLFNISIDSKSILDENEMLTSIAHEMVHVKQYALNELRQRNGYMSYKRKRFYYDTATLAEYYNFPWEIEAYGLEKALYYGWKQNQEMVDLFSSLAE